MAKLAFEGEVTSVQPRVRLTRSFDERTHNYLGYALRVHGIVGEETRDFIVGIGDAAQAKRGFRVGDHVAGGCERVVHPDTDPVDFFKATGLAVKEREAVLRPNPPPWEGQPPTLEEYRRRGHRRLSAVTYDKSCTSCMFGCRMAVEMIVDPWKRGRTKKRFETFCYGPKSCPLYAAGPTRKVPGRNGMSWTEEDWVDEDATAHRGADE